MLCQFAHRAFATKNPVMDSYFGLEDESFKVSEVIVDQPLDFALELIKISSVMRRRIRGEFGQPRYPPSGRGENLHRVAPKDLYPTGHIVDVALQDRVPALLGRHIQRHPSQSG